MYYHITCVCVFFFLNKTQTILPLSDDTCIVSIYPEAWKKEKNNTLCAKIYTTCVKMISTQPCVLFFDTSLFAVYRYN